MKQGKKWLQVVIGFFMVLGLMFASCMAEAADTEYKVTDLYWGYPTVLRQSNVVLKDAINYADEVMYSLDSEDVSIIAAQEILKNHTSIAVGEFLAVFGFETSLQEKCDKKAAEILLQYTAAEPGVVNTIVKKVESQCSSLDKDFGYISSWVNLVTEWCSMGFQSVKDQAWFEVIVEENIESIESIGNALGIASDVTEYASVILFCESLNMDTVDYLIENTNLESLRSALKKYKSYIESNYTSYIKEKYLTSSAIKKVLSFKSLIKNTPSLFGVVEATLGFIAKGMSEDFELGSAEDYMVACSLKCYMQDMDNAQKSIVTEFVNGIPTYSRILDHERAYAIYIASVKAYVDAVGSVDTSQKDVLSQYVDDIADNGSYEAQQKRWCEMLSDSSMSFAMREENTDIEYTDIKYVMDPSDTIVPDTAYVSEGKLFYGIRAGGEISIKSEYCHIPYMHIYRNSELRILEGSNITVDGDMELWRSEWETGKCVFELNGALTVMGDYNACYINQYVTTTEFEYPAVTNIVGEDAHFCVRGDTNLGSGTVENGIVEFWGGVDNEDWRYYLNFDNLGTGGIIFRTEPGKYVRLYKIAGISKPSEDATVDLFAQKNEENEYILTGTATGCQVTIYGNVRITEELKCDSLSTDDVVIDREVADIGGSIYADNATVTEKSTLKCTLISSSGYGDEVLTVYGKIYASGGISGNVYMPREESYIEAAGGVIESLDMAGGTLILNGSVGGGASSDDPSWILGSGTVYFNVPEGESAETRMFELEPGENGGTGASALTLKQTEEGAYVLSGNAPSHNMIVRGGNTIYLKDDMILNGMDYDRDETDISPVIIEGTVRLLQNLVFDGTPDITVLQGSALNIEGNVRHYSAGDISGDLWIYGTMSVAGNCAMYAGSTYSSTVYQGVTANICGSDASLTVGGIGWFSEVNLEGGTIYLEGEAKELSSTGNGRIVLSGTKAGTFQMGGLTITRTEGTNANLALTEDGHKIGVGEMGSCVNVAQIKMMNGTYALDSGEFHVGELVVGDKYYCDGASLDVQKKCTVVGNVNIQESGELLMQDAAADLTIQGDFYTVGKRDNYTEMTAGILRVSGDFSVDDGWPDFYATGDHVIEFNGTGLQKVYLSSSGSDNQQFATVLLTNASEEGVRFTDTIAVEKLFNHNGMKFSLYNDGSGSEIPDYDGDGVEDHLDMFPLDPSCYGLGFEVEPIEDQFYSGSAVCPAVVVRSEDGTLLELNTDYTVSYKNNMAIGEAKAIVKGIGSYGGEVEMTFQIVCDHDFEVSYVKNPVCGTDGYTLYVCYTCGEEYTEVIEAQEEHSFVREWEIEVESTCTTAGRRSNVCENCESLVTEELPLAEHIWNEEPTIDEPGYCDGEGVQSIHCSVCDVIQEGTQESIPGTEHRFGEWTVSKQATCTLEGERERVCSSCGYAETETYFVGHIWQDDESTDVFPDCETPGSASVHCDICGATKEGSEIELPAEGHRFGEWTVTEEATCTTNGQKVRICEVCGETEESEIPAMGHSFDDGKVTKEPTYTENGVKTYTCANCNVTKTETIDKLEKPTTPSTPSGSGTTGGNATTTPGTSTGSGTTGGTTSTTPGTSTGSGNAGGSTTGGTTTTTPVTPTLKLVKTVTGKDYSVTIAKTQVTGNGKAQKPKITVKYKNKKLKTKYYTVKYSANKYTGLATVTVTGKGTYKSKIPATKIQFVITPKKMKTPTVKVGKGTAKVSWKTEKGVSGYQIQISMSKNFKSGVQQLEMKSSVKSTAISNLTSKKTYYVRTRAYKTIQGSTFYGGWSSAKKVKIK